ncbi:MAG: transcriptional repressor LexA [Deltaproteobacteria bacterium]|nr:MAG: transcriptional repressor LexA [Deltaproteobacteria bacterium]
MNTMAKSQQHLTARQRQVLDFVTDYQARHGYSPTLREIAAHLRVSGPLPVSKHLDALEKKGWLKRDPVSRGIALATPSGRSVSLPIAGTVRAGHLAPAIEDVQGDFSIDQSAARGNDCFFLRVAGDSMIDAGIFEGDLALVRPQPVAENGAVVVAMVGGEATLKRFFREPDHIRLQPANAAMSPILVYPGDGEVTVVGTVAGIYRRLE